MNEVKPSPCTKDNALAAAIASAISGEKGMLAFGQSGYRLPITVSNYHSNASFPYIPE